MTDKNFTNQSFNIFKKRNLNEERVIDKYKITQNMKLSEMYKNIYSSKVGVAINHIKTNNFGMMNEGSFIKAEKTRKYDSI